MPRHLRASNEPVSQHQAIVDFYPRDEARALRIDEDAELRDKVDKLRNAQELLKSKRAAHKTDTDGLIAEIDELSTELREYARNNNKTKIFGVESVLELSPGVSRKIDPIKFLSFLKSLGKTHEFWDYVSVPIGEAEKHFGEAVLESSNVLVVEREDFKNLKFTQRRG